MKVLLDACVWGGARDTLLSAGHGVVWAGEWDVDPGDLAILQQAHREDRVLVTLDKDFGELAVLRGVPHSGVVRLVDIPAREQGRACLRALERHGKELGEGAIVTVERRRIRIRPPQKE